MTTSADRSQSIAFLRELVAAGSRVRKVMAEPLTTEEIDSLEAGLAGWGPSGQPNWADPKGECVPIPKLTYARLLVAARRGVEGFAQDAISHAEAHGVRET